MKKNLIIIDAITLADHINTFAKKALANSDASHVVDFDLLYKLEAHLRELPKVLKSERLLDHS